VHLPDPVGIHTSPCRCSCQPKHKPKQFLKIVPYFFISTGEESSRPTKHAIKIIILIFLTVKATILDTHGKKAVPTKKKQKNSKKKLSD